MKRRDLLAEIANAAKAAGLRFDLDRQGARHEIWNCGGFRFPMPRHNEINEITAGGIRKELEVVLGLRWWQ